MPTTEYITPNSPHLHVWNTQFRVYGEKQILPTSTVYLCFHALLRDTLDFPRAVEAEIEDSDDEEGDVDILIGRKCHKNDGDSQQLPPAHTPFYPEVFPSLGVDIRW